MTKPPQAGDHPPEKPEEAPSAKTASVAAQLASIGEFDRRIIAWEGILGESEPATVFRVPCDEH